MRHHSAKRSLGRRIIALAAAYAIALSGLIASFSAAQAVAGAAGNLGLIICHSAAGAPSPAHDDGSDQTCNASCCIGCVLLLAAVPPPPAEFVPVRQTTSRSIKLHVEKTLVPTPETTSHQSRAPPPTV